MTFDVRWVRYGRPAAEALREAISQAKGDEPLDPVTVLVPSNHVGVAARRMLASGKLGPICSRGAGIVAVDFLTPYRLAELLGAARLAGTGRRPVSTPVIAAALRTTLNEDPGLFRPVASHPATESALVDAYRELRDLSSDALDALAATGTRASEVIRLHRATRRRLEQHWYDEQDLMDSAVANLQAGGGAKLGPVIVYLPQQISRHSAELVSQAAQNTGLTVLAGTTGSPKADAEVATSIQRLGTQSSPPEDIDAGDIATVAATRFVTASDADEEVRAAVRQVVDKARQGTPLDRIAILHASPQPYARLVHEHYAAAGIATNGASVQKLAERMAGRTLLQLLGMPEQNFRRQDLFSWLAGAPVHHRGRWAPVTAWERISRSAAVISGRDDWDRRLLRLATEWETNAEQLDADPDSPPWRAERHREDAARARQLRNFALELIDDLAEADARPRRWSDHATWAHGLLSRTLGGTQRRERWPDVEREAAEKVELALDRLAALDYVEQEVSLEIFTRTLELELENDLGRTGRFGEGILVGPVSMGIGLDLDLVVVLGLAEGSFPARVREDSLLPDEERMAAGGQLPLRRQRVEREHRQLLAALAGAATHLLGIPRGDLRRSSERIPSRWALEIASRLAGEQWWSEKLRDARNDWVDHVPSYSAGIKRLEFPATAQEYRLRTLSGQAGRRPDLRALDDPVLTAGGQTVDARHSHSFTRFDGNLAGLAIPSPAERATSATRLQRWPHCPFDYLLQEVFGVQAVENPEEELTITPLAKGSLYHEILEQFITEVVERPEGAPAPEQPWSAADIARMLAIAEEHFADYESKGLTGRPIFWERDRVAITTDLKKLLEKDSAYRAQNRTRPVAAELPFGLKSAQLEAVCVDLPDGRSVCFRGIADRLDVAEDGSLHVLDYKTGKADSYKGLDEADPDQQGMRLQLPIYGLAARAYAQAPEAEVVARYWFATSKGKFLPIGYPVTPQILEHFSRTLGTIVEGIEHGAFPNFPRGTSTSFWVDCNSCDPDNLGVADLRRAWDRKRADKALAVFANLADPRPDDEGADD